MANQLAIRSHTELGDEILVEANAHIYYYEAGGPAALSGVMCRCLQGERGVFKSADVESALRPCDPHFPRTRLVCIEDTHNRGGGKIWPLERIVEVAGTARQHGLQLHLDGARIWNAAAATGIAEKQWAAPFDTVSVCFSKGLGAPVGSALVGSKALLARARRFRKMFGGGMRQAGIVAAGALFALHNHRARLVVDHANAKALAEGISQRLAGLSESEVPAVAKTFKALRQAGYTLDSTLATFLIALDRLSAGGEGFLIGYTSNL
jgi:threonine aldolase